MGSPIKFGSRIFPARGAGRLNPQSNNTERLLRYSAGLNNAALISLNATAIMTINIPISIGNRLIRIKDIIGFVEFVDAATANYVVSDAAKIYLSAASFGNLDTSAFIPFFSNRSGFPYDIIANVVNGQITLDLTIYGGDVQRITLITPGAGDSVAARITICYEPI